MPGRLLSCTAMTLLLCVCGFGQAQSASRSGPKMPTNEDITTMVNDQIGYLNGTINKEKPVPYLKVLGRKKGDKGETLTGYQFYAPALPKGKNYTLMSWKVDGEPYSAWQSVMIDNDGRALTRGKPPVPIELWVPAAPGEPKKFALISDDGQSKAYMMDTPFPIEAKDRNCKLQAQMLAADGMLYLLVGSGFPPNSLGHLSTQSEGVPRTVAARSNADGSMYMPVLPYVVGKTKGTTRVQAQFKECSVPLSFDWGEGAVHPK